jgi:hypothetical protein
MIANSKILSLSGGIIAHPGQINAMIGWNLWQDDAICKKCPYISLIEAQ